MSYEITKVLNNHVVLATGDDQKNYVIFGTGIGYGKKINQALDETKITEVYFLSKADMAYFSDITADMSPNIIAIAEEIIIESKKLVTGKFNANLLLMLADHINFAIQRSNEGITIKSPLEYEIKRLYPTEMRIGKESLKLIRRKLGVILPKEEEAMIALHIVNSQVDSKAIQETMTITEISNKIITIINYHFQINLDMETTEMTRFLIHLRYFILKGIKGDTKKTTEPEYDGLYKFLVLQNPEVNSCISKIENYLKKEKNWEISENDQIYLMLHINRLIQDKKGGKT